MILVFLIARLVMLALAIGIVVRVWRASTLDGLLTLFVPIYVLVALVKYWKNPDHDIKFYVLLQVIFVGVALFAAQSIASQELRERQQYAAAQANAQAAADNTVDTTDDSADAESADTEDVPVVEFGPAERLARRQAKTAPPSAPPPPPTTDEGPHVVRSPTTADDGKAVPPPSFRQAVASATFLRGVFERESAGIAIDVPAHFHALSATDVHRIEASERVPVDTRELGWVLHESVPLEDASGWHITVRWHRDGWVNAAGMPDGWKLLDDAQRGKGVARLAGSGGELVGYAIAPSYSGGVADWVEERLPAGAAASALDCHALKLGSKGVVEFSVVGAPAGSQALCDASVRLLARSTRFTNGGEYSSAGTDGARAPYTLGELVAGVR